MCDSKRIVTENERNAIFTVLTPEECLLFGRSLNDLCNEYKENDGAVDEDTLSCVLGKLPQIPNTHDMNAKLEAADARHIYVKKMNSIFDFLEYELQHGHI